MATLSEQVREVGREIGLRRTVYPRFVENKRMTQEVADKHRTDLEAAYATLKRLRDLTVEDIEAVLANYDLGDADRELQHAAAALHARITGAGS